MLPPVDPVAPRIAYVRMLRVGGVFSMSEHIK
jgi:hypothetical protein